MTPKRINNSYLTNQLIQNKKYKNKIHDSSDTKTKLAVEIWNELEFHIIISILKYPSIFTHFKF